MTEPESDPPCGTQEGVGKAEKPEQLHEHIGRKLRTMFDDVVAEPIPDKFRELLEDLERKKPKS